jgi:hypothetical protein
LFDAVGEDGFVSAVGAAARDRYRLREFGIHESDGAPDERSAVRSTNLSVTKRA